MEGARINVDTNPEFLFPLQPVVTWGFSAKTRSSSLGDHVAISSRSWVASSFTENPEENRVGRPEDRQIYLGKEEDKTST